MKLLPIGYSDYKQIIEEERYYVDKTLLIADLIRHGGLVTLITRPRRFGKTLNLSMLKYFFEKSEKSHAPLFEDKKIWEDSHMRAMQGKYPLIFLTFKNLKEPSWEETYDKFIHLIANEYNRHAYLCHSNELNDDEKNIFKRISSLSAPKSEYSMGLLYLSQFLTSYHKEKTIILIDEYDAPIYEGVLSGYYEKITDFIRNFLGNGLKDNSNLKLSVVSGVLRTAKEGIFSDLNNLNVFTLLQELFADKFGFTQHEIEQLLNDYALLGIKEQFKTWYNGYLIGEVKIYNPWSSLSCVNERGKLRPYWVNTSGNGLIKQMIASSRPEIKDQCGELLSGKSLPKIRISDQIVIPSMKNDPNSIWTLMLSSGYVTAKSYELIKGRYHADIILPNEEIATLFQDMITDLFKQGLGMSDVAELEMALQNSDGEMFSTLLSKFVSQSMSWHDISEDEAEKSYHLFVLGLLVILSDSYSVRSNRESGYGRYDISLIPHDRFLPGFLIEFKKKEKNETMEACAHRALEQILQKNYAAELESLGITKKTLFAIAFYKKELLLKQVDF